MFCIQTFLAGSVNWSCQELCGKTLIWGSDYPTDPFQYLWRSDPWGHQLLLFELCQQHTTGTNDEYWQPVQPNHNGCFLVHHSWHIVHIRWQSAGIQNDMIQYWMTECTWNPMVGSFQRAGQTSRGIWAREQCCTMSGNVWFQHGSYCCSSAPSASQWHLGRNYDKQRVNMELFGIVIIMILMAMLIDN